MAKAVDAFRTISEVAEDLNVPKHVLRFWEGKFPQLRPMKRGGGRRFYRPEDVDLLKGIRHLLYDAGYTIKGVQKVMRDSGLDWVKACARTANASTGRGNEPAAEKPKRGRPRSTGLNEAQRRQLQAALEELESLKGMLAAAGF
ncbi:MAG: MerR family transcriptional regulator [Hyphomicrobiaceae bacterium]